MGIWEKRERRDKTNHFTGKRNPSPPPPPQKSPKPSVLVDAESLMEIGQFIVKELAKSKENKGKHFELNIHLYPV